jgi:hypothetical protein
VFAPRATATIGAWVHEPPRGRTWKQWDLERLPAFFPSSPAVTYKTQKKCNKQLMRKTAGATIVFSLETKGVVVGLLGGDL